MIRACWPLRVVSYEGVGGSSYTIERVGVSSRVMCDGESGWVVACRV